MLSLLDINEIFDIDEEAKMNDSDTNLNAMNSTRYIQKIVDDNREGPSDRRSKTYHISVR
ncbi:27634_t:CDS:2, partial [Dentiscutata erythropus]